MIFKKQTAQPHVGGSVGSTQTCHELANTRPVLLASNNKYIIKHMINLNSNALF